MSTPAERFTEVWHAEAPRVLAYASPSRAHGPEAWFVVDPATGAFRGVVGHPEKDATRVGPEEPMWTITMKPT